MKNSGKLSFIVFLTFVLILELVSCDASKPPAGKEKQESVQVFQANINTKGVYLVTDGTIDFAEKPVPIYFRVPGILEKGELELKPGTTFKKGQLLFQIDNRKAYAEYRSYQRDLAALVEAFLRVIEKEVPTESTKWKLFASGIHPSQLLPEFPAVNARELAALNNSGVAELYDKTKRAETSMTDYFYVAIQDGMILETFVKPGKKLSSGQKVATWSGSGSYYLRIILPDNVQSKLYQSADGGVQLFDLNGKLLGTGKLDKVQHSKTGEEVLGYTVTPARQTVFSKDQQVRVRTANPTSGKLSFPPSSVSGTTVCVLNAGGTVEKVTISRLKQGDLVLMNYRKQLIPGKKYRPELMIDQ